MAVKKSEIYSSLWASCDALRGGMDASQYKDYVLVLLFVKYVSDKYSGDPDGLIEIPEGGSFADMVALRGNKDIGEKINIIIANLAEGVMPLSAIKDMIGSQATKAMHVVARFAPQLLSHGVWTDGAHLTVIETYPALCRARLGPQVGIEPIPKTGREADILDAAVCARIARDFQLNRERLEPPTDDTPPSEGWIWAPRRISVEA